MREVNFSRYASTDIPSGKGKSSIGRGRGRGRDRDGR